MQIVIIWGNPPEQSTEYLDIDLNNLDQVEQLEETTEWWPVPGTFVTWNVYCRLEKGQREDSQHILVTYERNNQNDKNIECLLKKPGHEGYCGTNKIIVDRDERHGVCQARSGGQIEWDSNDRNQKPWSSRWKVIGRPRNRHVRDYLERDSRFRSNILPLDEKCMISGESTEETLDAAHICPVADSDDDSAKNGIILRTDIHRLYDRGMFIINPENGRVERGSIRRDLSDEYKELLGKAELPKKTLNRVQEALRRKWNRPHP